MSLQDRELENPPRGQGLPCAIAAALEELDAEDQETLRRWLAQPPSMKGRRSDRQIAEDLEAELGRPFGDYQIGPHRRRSCRCYRGVPK
jgi:hypothetical protein